MITTPNADLNLSALSLPQPSQKEKSELGQEDFMTLMIEQFRNQDPFQPMENGQFIAQMAQFSQVSGIAEMNQSMGKLADSLASNQALQASTLVGRSVLAEGNLVNLRGEDSTVKGGVDLPYATGSAFVRIFDNSGQPIRDIPLGPRNAGVNTFEWDGKLPDGEQAPPGLYRIAAGLRNGDAEEALDTYVATPVQSITLSGGRSAQITTEAGQQISLSQVKAIL
ncbi:MAG TPA: flagellar hook assembly protein FlgD [Chromatiales bacterium]|nr:flagellar hook assembly protein FlgD [Chromatiales bacterium]